jgi:hypothetical protein
MLDELQGLCTDRMPPAKPPAGSADAPFRGSGNTRASGPIRPGIAAGTVAVFTATSEDSAKTYPRAARAIPPDTAR